MLNFLKIKCNRISADIDDNKKHLRYKTGSEMSKVIFTFIYLARFHSLIILDKTTFVNKHKVKWIFYNMNIITSYAFILFLESTLEMIMTAIITAMDACLSIQGSIMLTLRS